MSNEDNTGKLVWFFAGAAIGASIALLYAPASGDVTRRRLKRTAEDGRDKLSEASRDVLERGKDVYERGRKLAEGAADLLESGRKLVDG